MYLGEVDRCLLKATEKSGLKRLGESTYRSKRSSIGSVRRVRGVPGLQQLLRNGCGTSVVAVLCLLEKRVKNFCELLEVLRMDIRGGIRKLGVNV